MILKLRPEAEMALSMVAEVALEAEWSSITFVDSVPHSNLHRVTSGKVHIRLLAVNMVTCR